MNGNVTNRRTAFVTGGSGFVGGRLIEMLAKNGWDVRALARDQRAVEAVRRRGATPILGNIDDRETLRKGMHGSEVVFHVAAMFKLWGDCKEFARVNIDGTRAIIDAAVGTPSVRRLIEISAAAVVIGDPKPMIGVDESAPVQKLDSAPYSATKAASEELLLSANGRRRQFETIALRPPMIWGAGMPMLDQMTDAVKAGNWQWVNKGENAMSTCHVDNLIDALLLAADRGRGGQAYFVADVEEGTLKSVMTDLLATKGIKTGDKSVGFGMAWTLAGAMAFFWRLFRLKGEPPITRQMLQLIGKPFTVSIDKAKRELGYSPRISWKRGIAEMAGRNS
jgi:nucleoside-diphosphate-sugar epimerase